MFNLPDSSGVVPASNVSAISPPTPSIAGGDTIQWQTFNNGGETSLVAAAFATAAGSGTYGRIVTVTNPYTGGGTGGSGIGAFEDGTSGSNGNGSNGNGGSQPQQKGNGGGATPASELNGGNTGGCQLPVKASPAALPGLAAGAAAAAASGLPQRPADPAPAENPKQMNAAVQLSRQRHEQEVQRRINELKSKGLTPITLLEAIADGRITADEYERLVLTYEEVTTILSRLPVGIKNNLEDLGFKTADEYFPDLPPYERYLRFVAKLNHSNARLALFLQASPLEQYVKELYKFVRGSNPVHFIGETLIVIATGEEPVLQEERSRLAATLDLIVYLVLLKGLSWGMGKLRGAILSPLETVEGTVLAFPSGGKLVIFKDARPAAAAMEAAIEEAAAGRSVLITTAGDVLPVGRIAALTGISESEVLAALTHFRQTKHLLSSDGKLVRGAFEREPFDDALFTKVARGEKLTPGEQKYLSELIKHEATEAAILARLGPAIDEAMKNGTMGDLLRNELRKLGVPEETIVKLLAEELQPISPFRIAHYIAHFSGAINPRIPVE